MAIISSSAQHLKKHPENKALQNELLDFIVAEIASMDTLVNKLLGLASYKAPLLLPYNLTDELNGLLDRWGKVKDHKTDVSIIRKYDDQPIRLTGDPAQIGQVILNLIRNSEESMPTGGTIAVEMTTNNDDETVDIKINDTGKGIASNEMPNPFNKFFTTKQNGLGLGLMLCRQIIQAHNGVITVKNKKDSGMEAFIQLPIKPLQGSAKAVPSPLQNLKM